MDIPKTIWKVISDVNSELVIFSFGSVLDLSLEVASELNCSLVDMRFIKPLDENLIEEYSKSYKHIVTIEENILSGGAGSAVNELLTRIGHENKLKMIGISDEFPIVGNQEDQREAAGLTKNAIIKKLSLELNLKNLKKKVTA